MVAFFGGLIVFLGVHSARIFAFDTRNRLVASYGEGAWKGIYTLVSLVSFVAIIYGYQDAKAGLGFVWAPPVWARHIAVVLMLPALIFLSLPMFPQS